MKRKVHTCPFCRERFFPYHELIGLDKRDAIVYSDDYVFVTPDISPISKGHFLIITRHHYNNYAQTPSCVKKSLWKAVNLIKEEVFKNENFLLFEHGASVNEEKSAGNSINHAHVHLIMSESNLLMHVREEKKYIIEIKGSTIDMYAEKYKNHPYIWIMNNNEQSFFKVNHLPSQYLRKKYAELSKMEYSYDWKIEFDNLLSIKQYHENLNLIRSMLEKGKQ